MIARYGELHDPKLKPKIQGDYCTWNCWLFSVLKSNYGFRAIQPVGRERGARAIYADLAYRSVVYNDRILFCLNNRADSGDARPS